MAIKRKDWISIELESCATSDQFRIYEAATDKRHTIQSQKYCCWGSSDVLILRQHESIETAKQLLDAELSAGAFNRHVFYGHALHEFEPELASLSAKYPLVAVTFVKIKREIIQELEDKHLGLTAFEWIKGFLDTNAKAYVQQKLRDFDPRALNYLVCAATGWADAMIVFFSSSYASIKLCLSALRSIECDQVLKWYSISKKETTPKHALITTCTITGVHIESIRDPTAVETLISRLDDKYSTPFMGAHIRPGHLKDAHSLFHDDSSNRTVPAFGREDIYTVFTSDKESSLQKFLRYFFTTLLPNVATPNTPILSTETRICLPEGEMFFAEENSPTVVNHKKTPRVSPQKMVPGRSLEDLLQPHTAAAIKQIRRGLHAIYLEESTCDSYESLILCHNTAGKRLENRIGSDGTLGGLYKDVCEEFAEYCTLMELCFKDRYRGIYPAGSTSATPSLMSHGSFHKILASTDGLCNAALKEACNLFVDLQKGINVISGAEQPLSICCFIGNAYRPNIKVLKHLGLGFINIPFPLLFSPMGLIYVLHEVGHIYWLNNGYYAEDRGERLWGNDKLGDSALWEEIIADYFAISVIYQGNWEYMLTQITPLVKELVGKQNKEDHLKDFLFRVFSAAVLHDFLTERLEHKSTMYFEEYAQSQKSGSNEGFLELLANHTQEEFRAIGIKILNLRTYYDGIFANSVSKNSMEVLYRLAKTSEGLHPMVALARNHFQSENTGESIVDFTHMLWQTHIRYTGNTG